MIDFCKWLVLVRFYLRYSNHSKSLGLFLEKWFPLGHLFFNLLLVYHRVFFEHLHLLHIDIQLLTHWRSERCLWHFLLFLWFDLALFSLSLVIGLQNAGLLLIDCCWRPLMASYPLMYVHPADSSPEILVLEILDIALHQWV